MGIYIFNQNCVEGMRELPENSVDSVVTDPPYEIGFGSTAGLTDWDAAGIAYSVDLWREVRRVLKPGGHLLSFGAPRTYHRMATAIEDAGFEIRDSLHWVKKGFPMGNANIAKAFDKREGLLAHEGRDFRVDAGTGTASYRPPSPETYVPPEPKGENAKKWAGWGTVLKPSHEPIVVARKPFEGTVLDSLLTHGVGAMNIDAARYGEGGKWPANLLLSHAPECDPGKCAPDCPVTEMNRQQSKSADFFPVFRYEKRASPKDRDGGLNTHPTLKPVALMRWLVRLVTPKGGFVLDPFMGSGSTAIAAIAENCGFYGYEKELRYYDIAEERIKKALA